MWLFSGIQAVMEHKPDKSSLESTHVNAVMNMTIPQVDYSIPYQESGCLVEVSLLYSCNASSHSHAFILFTYQCDL